MLVVHPASTCDVCLESYTGRSESAPYSTPCGHIFCFRCLQSLRQHICPLCRSPFDASDIRRLHVDCTDSHLNARRPPSPRRTSEPRIELPTHNALGLVEEVPRAVQLQRKISDLVLKSSLSSAVRERGLRELIQEIHAFLGSEPLERHTDLRAEFLLFYRFTDLQARHQQLENSVFDLRTENNHNSQMITDWERRYQDIQRSRARDQESARIVEASLRERLRIEELEWQRKYDFVSEECAKLRDELDKLRFSSPNVQHSTRAPRRSTSTTQIYYVATEGSASSDRFAHNDLKGVTSGKNRESSKTQDEADVFRYFNPDLFHLSPVPERLSLSISKSSDSEEEMDLKKQRHRAPESPSRTSSTSSNISRASESAAALKPVAPVATIRTGTGRQRSESNPIRGVDMAKFYHPGNQPEISSSAPSSYMYRAPSPTRALFPTTPPPPPEPPVHDSYHRDVARLYSLLEKQDPGPGSRLTSEPSNLSKTRNSGIEGTHSRPPLPRSTSFQQTQSSDFGSVPSSSATPSFSQNLPFSSRRAHPHMQVQTTLASAPNFQRTAVSSPPTQVQASEALSPIQRTPPRPVLPRMHSYFHLYSPSPSKPVSPKENSIRAQPSLLRRGSLSSASAAAAQAAGQSSPAVVHASSFRTGKSHARGLFGGQDSD